MTCFSFPVNLSGTSQSDASFLLVYVENVNVTLYTESITSAV